MRELMWMTARATTVLDWGKVMNQIKVYDANAWKDLDKINPVIFWM